MPPFTPKSTANQTDESTSEQKNAPTPTPPEAVNSAANEAVTELTPNLTELTESGPAARQRVFVEERLAGATTTVSAPTGTQTTGTQTTAQMTTRGIDATGGEDETAGQAAAQPVARQPGALAAERQASLAAYRSRQLAQTTVPTAPGQRPGALATASRSLDAAASEAEMPAFIETNRWLLLGPSVVRDGQSGKQSAMSGRVRDIAVAPGGERLYIATANGGVWRSEDGGQSWLSLMDTFDLNPTYYRADSLACGALALVPGNWAGEDILYVGSGEPGVAPWFQGDSAYFGVGPIVSTDGGLTWLTEPSEPSLAGSAFYELAVDPTWPARVVGATLLGLYRREPDETGAAHWVKKQDGYFCSVVVSHRSDYTIFYGAEWGGRVWQSEDGERWAPLGNEFPEGQVGRIGLAVQPDNPEIVYALVANIQDHLLGVFRLDCAEDLWRLVEEIPATLFGPDLTRAGQGGYDLAIAIDPSDVNRIYVGGSIVHSDGIRLSDSSGDWSGDWSGALYRCEIEIQPTNKRIQAISTYIGGAVHGDLHVLRHAPGDAHKLWVGCDGGIFFTAAPTADPTDEDHGAGLFFPCNTGLSTLTMNYLGMHPTEEAVLFCGTQDNGGLRYTGDPVWLYSSGGDSGYFFLNWDNPYQVITTYVQNQIFRSFDGGLRYSYDAIHVLPASGEAVQFYAPLAGPPYNPAQPETATRVAFGGKRVWLSDQLGGDGVWWDGQRWLGEVDWVSLPNNRYEEDAVDGLVETLHFASATKLYAGTTTGRLYRYDLVGEQWQRTMLPAIANDRVAAYVGTITSIAVDSAENSGNAIYITLGGFTNPHRVWYFDGVQWEPRSGPQQNDSAANAAVGTESTEAGISTNQALLDVQHNAIVVDPQQPTHLYVAADIGIWRSTDGGRHWQVFARGLPDAAVIDLQLHEKSRLLRAATHGRGVYEFDLGRPQRAVDLYIRDHALDLGRHPAEAGLPDPTRCGALVQPGQSPDIKLDVPDEAGRYQLTGIDPYYRTPFPPSRAPENGIDFYTFATKLAAETDRLVTHSRSNIQTMVYVQVHNRGRSSANNVRVMLLLATSKVDDSGGDHAQIQPLPPMPNGYEAAIIAGQPIASDEWQTIGLATVHGVRPGHPQVARFVLDADHLPTPGRLRTDDHYRLVAIVHSADDPFVATVTSDAEPTRLTPANNRHVAHREVQVISFTGQVPKGTMRRRPLSPGPENFIADHHVRRGETLSQLAKHYYRSAQHWPVIYRANRNIIGADPDLLQIGLRLKIPRL